MPKEMIISVNGREKKIAIIDNGRVTEFYIERGEENSGVVGNIYKGKVQRVLPGMQSAFVDIGLERDAFLYVSDFFDEEEELERIMLEKSKKATPEEASREAKDTIERQRVEREKQMESAQEKADSIAEVPGAEVEVGAAEPVAEEKKGRRRGRRGRGRDRDRSEERVETAREEVSAPVVADEDEDTGVPVGQAFQFEMDDSGFERVIDDTETGDQFKDAYRQEQFIDQVRAAEFDIESIAVAEVGTLMDSIAIPSDGFERIADEDEEEVEMPAKRARGKASDKKAPRGKKSDAKAKVKESDEAENDEAVEVADADLEDSEASVKESSETAEMTVRRGGRGGRGRRRGGRGPAQAGDGKTEERYETSEMEETVNAEEELMDAELSPIDTDSDEPATEGEQEEAPKKRGRGGDNKGGRGEKSQQRGGEKKGGRDTRSSGGRGKERRDRGPQPTIADLLKEGQEILVQIAKEPIARKGARITSHIALPGRYLVYMPTIEHLGVSRKIESSNERARLRAFIQNIKKEEEVPSGGFIVRTAGIGVPEANLRDDARYLVKLWQDMKKNAEKKKSPAIIHQDLDIIQRLLRDQLSDDFSAIRVDNEEEYTRIADFVSRIQPKMVNRVKLYTRDAPILEAFGVQEEIEKALKPRVWLKSGGYLVINQTEALVAIDVNTGKFVGKGNARLEDTITKTNMEAVEEIARQIRLRDLGGIIVLDLIDMEDRRNRQKVLGALQEHLSHDKSPTKVLSFNDFGLIIMTRKRVKQSLERTLCAPCEHCQSSGWVKSPQTVCFEILEESRRLSRTMKDIRHVTLRVNPEVANALHGEEREIFDEVEAYLGPVDVTADASTHQAQFDFAFV